MPTHAVRQAPDRHDEPHRRRHHADPRHGPLVLRGQQARDQEGPGAARPHDRQPLPRAVHAHQELLRARREAPLGRLPLDGRGHELRRQGREPRRHHRDDRRHERRHVHLPRQARRHAAEDHRAHRRHRDQRRRRQAPAPHAGDARPLHHPRELRPPRRPQGRHRGRPLPQPRLRQPRARAQDHGRRRHARGPAHLPGRRPGLLRRAADRRPRRRHPRDGRRLHAARPARAHGGRGHPVPPRVQPPLGPGHGAA